MIETWLPTAACLGAIGFIWTYWRIDKTRAEKKFDEFVEERKRLMTLYLTEPTHRLLCDNHTLRLQQHTSGEMKKVRDEVADLKDQIMEKFVEVEKLIRLNGKGANK